MFVQIYWDFFDPSFLKTLFVYNFNFIQKNSVFVGKFESNWRGNGTAARPLLPQIFHPAPQLTPQPFTQDLSSIHEKTSISHKIPPKPPSQHIKITPCCIPLHNFSPPQHTLHKKRASGASQINFICLSVLWRSVGACGAVWGFNSASCGGY